MAPAAAAACRRRARRSAPPLGSLSCPPLLLNPRYLPLNYCKQDLLSCLLLSEAVYKAAEGPPAAAAAALNRLRSALPPGLVPLQSVQFSRRAAEHRCG